MAQNNRLKEYLIACLIFSAILMLNSCKDDFYDQHAKYHFVNETDYVISYNIGLDNFNIAPKSTNVFEETTRGEGKQKSEASNFNNPFSRSNVVTIKFDHVKCLLNIKADEPNSVRNIKNYAAKRIDDHSFQFTYTFTTADYDRAVTCQ